MKLTLSVDQYNLKLVATGLLELVPELSFQARSTWEELRAVAVKLEGAVGTAMVVAVAVFDGAESPPAADALT